jgi:sigma-E factor negative regulatory protein RseB
VTDRPWLLLSAAVTVTVPCLIAIGAIVGHEHVTNENASLATSASASASASAFADSSLAGPVPVAPAKTDTPVRDALAAVQRMSGERVTVDGTWTAGQQAIGLRLLARAARASQVTSYQGIELTSQEGVGGEVTTVSQVWHSGGGPTVTQASSAPADVMRSPAGIFGLTSSLVALLGTHYTAVYRGASYTAGRLAALVEVYRFDGSLAARFWLDRQTLVPLRRELFDASNKPVGVDAFIQVRFGPLTGQAATAATAARSAAVARAEPAWATAASPGTLLTSLASQGWRLPDTLPDGLPLYAAASTGTGAAEVIDLEYSDGLAVVSLFVQRGTLTPDMAGWRPAILGGHAVYVSGRSVAWSWHGLVCTMIADAPPRTVADAVAALPRSAPAGVIDRLGRGLDRLAHLADPFQ